MAKRRTETDEAAAYPQDMVRVVRTPGGEYSTEVRVVADAAADAAAVEDGFQPAADLVPPPPEPVAYPKWLYHPEQPAQVVQSEQGEKALGEGWVESPADFPEPPPTREPR